MKLLKLVCRPGGQYWSVHEGPLDRCSFVRLESEVHVFHGWGGIIRHGGASDGVPVDDANPFPWVIDAVAVGDFVSLRPALGILVLGMVQAPWGADELAFGMRLVRQQRPHCGCH